MGNSNPGNKFPERNGSDSSINPATAQVEQAVNNLQQSTSDALGALQSSELFKNTSHLFGLFARDGVRTVPMPPGSSPQRRLK